MDNSLDKVIWVDEDDNILGEVTRGEAHQKGILHRVAATYLTNDQGQILVHQRMDKKLDHSSSGHVDVGENYLDAAARELREELGVENAKLKKIGHGTAIDKSEQRDIRHTFDIFVVKANPGEINKEEVLTVFWADPKEVFEDMQKAEPEKYTEGFKVSLRCFCSFNH